MSKPKSLKQYERRFRQFSSQDRAYCTSSEMREAIGEVLAKECADGGSTTSEAVAKQLWRSKRFRQSKEQMLLLQVREAIKNCEVPGFVPVRRVGVVSLETAEAMSD